MARDDGVATGVERRRRYWKKDEKRRIVAESLEEGASAAEVARRYGLNVDLRFTWRRQGGQFVVHVKALPGNPYDGHTLGVVLPEIEKQIADDRARCRRSRLSRPQCAADAPSFGPSPRGNAAASRKRPNAYVVKRRPARTGRHRRYRPARSARPAASPRLFRLALRRREAVFRPAARRKWSRKSGR